MGKKLDKNIQDWITSLSLSEEEIVELTTNILSNPSLISKTSIGDDNHFYSYSQMIEMFVCGMSAKPDKKIKKMNTSSAYGKMRTLDKGDTIVLPYDKWNSARTAASKLKKDYGVRYTVTLRARKKEKEILVTRVE